MDHTAWAPKVIALLALAWGPGCNSNESAAGQSSSAAAPAVTSAEATASAAPALSPPLAAIAADSWKDPDGGPDIKLVSSSLEKCFGFKGYSLMLPEGSKLETLMGARGCLAQMPGAKKGYQLAVLSDEIKTDWRQKDQLKNVKAKTFDKPDAFLYEIDNNGKPSYVGWWEGKFGTVTVRCNAMARQGDEPYTFDVKRAVLELCRTLKHE